MNEAQLHTHGHQLGICLSGGGFRAALYALGVLRYLAEADELRKVRVISSVSGGSVATAALLSGINRNDRDVLASGFVAEILEPFIDAVSSANLRNRAVRRWAPRRVLGGKPRNLVLGETLGDALFPELGPLSELPPSPQAIITATDLWAGRAFRFSRQFIGSWDAGYDEPPEQLRVSAAVAASAAAPPWIPALELPTLGLKLKPGVPSVLRLTDGGVYDNLGVEWFQGWGSGRPRGAEFADDLIVVNASGPLRRDHGRLRGVRALNRSRKIQYAQTQATRVRWFVNELEAGRQRGSYLGITADPRRYRLPTGDPIEPAYYADALPSNLVRPLAGLRTDLNKFSREECKLLAYHGYCSAHARFASLRRDAAVREPAWREFAGMSAGEAERFELELSGRRHRIGVGEQLR
jgi:NTE family protein